MPGVSRDNDTAGGDLIPSQTTVKVDGELVIVDGDGVAGHGVAPHIPQSISADLNSNSFHRWKKYRCCRRRRRYMRRDCNRIKHSKHRITKGEGK